MIKEYNVNHIFKPEEFFLLGMKKAQKDSCHNGGECCALYHEQNCHKCLEKFKEENAKQ